ncbi:MAG: hypothetical protein KHY77_11255 [Butyricicoccus pullicaecorum]|nr:hypothetical protein [Butyricicoccus pullicaecorum]
MEIDGLGVLKSNHFQFTSLFAQRRTALCLFSERRISEIAHKRNEEENNCCSKEQKQAVKADYERDESI